MSVGSSGAALAGNSRYIQYSATLSTSEPDQTPILNEVTINYALSGETSNVDLSVTKTSWQSAVPGSPLQYEISYRNALGDTAANVVIVDRLPAGLTVDSVYAMLPWSVITSTDTVTWTTSSVGGGEAGWLNFTARVDDDVPGGAVLTNTVDITTSSTDLVAANNEYLYPVTVLAPTRDVYVYKYLSGGAATAGQELTYTLSYGNNGNSAASEVVLTDTLPSGLTLVTSTQGSPMWPSPYPPSSIADQQLVWDLGMLSYGNQIQVRVRVNDDVVAGTQLINTAEIATSDSETDYFNNRTTNMQTVMGSGVDLSVTKTSWQSAVPGSPLQYEISYRNALGDTAANVVIVNHLPAGLSVDSVYAMLPWSVITSTDTVTWTTSSVGGGEGGLLGFGARVDNDVPGGAVLTNAVDIATSSTDLVATNNEYLYPVTVLTPTRDVYVYKYLSGGAATAGQELTYTLSYGNNGNSAASEVVLTDTLPAGLTFITSSPYPPSSITGQQVVWDLGTLSYGNQIQVRVRVNDDVVAGTQLTNTAEIATSDSETDYFNNQTTNMQTVMASGVDLSVTKTSWQSAIPGNPLQYEISYRNALGDAAANVVIVDHLPAGLTVDSVYAMLPWSVITSTDTVTWTTSSVGGGEAGWLNFTARVDDDVPGGTVLTNTVDITTSSTDLVAANNEYLYPVTVLAPTRDVYVYKYLSGGAATAGQELTYTLSYGNNGNSAASEVVLTDTLPSGLTLVTSTQGSPMWPSPYPPSSIADQQLVWDLGMLSYGNQIQVRVRVNDDVVAGTQLINTAEIATSDSETDYFNNQTTNMQTVMGSGVDLSVTKTSWQSAVPGSPLQYEISYRNALGDTAANVVIVDHLPAGLSVDSVYAMLPWSVITSTDTVTWTTSSVGGGEAGWLNFTARVDDDVPGGAVLTNTVDITTSSTDLVAANNEYLYPVTVLAPTRDVYVYKYLSGGAATAGQELTYTLSYGNNGNSAASEVVLTDTLPSGLTFVTSSPYPPSSITGQQLVWDLGTLSYGNSIQVRVRVNDDVVAGTQLTNTAEIATSDSETDYFNNQTTNMQTVMASGVDLSVSKTSWQSAIPGSPLQYEITYRNALGDTAANVVIVNHLPAGLSVDSVYAMLPWSVLTSTDTVTWTTSSVGGGEAGWLNFTARVDDDVPGGTVLTNTVDIATSSTDLVATNNEYFYPVTVLAPTRDVYVYKYLSGGAATAGQELTYTLSYGNNGNSAASEVVLTDTLPAGLTFVTSTQGSPMWPSPYPPSSIADQQLVWDLGMLSYGNQIQVRVRVNDDVVAGTQLINTAEIATSDSETDYFNNQATNMQTVMGSTSYTISGNAGIAGATLSYTDGAPQTTAADVAGFYTITVSSNWSGIVTPSKTGYIFTPVTRTYTSVVADMTGEDYIAIANPVSVSPSSFHGEIHITDNPPLVNDVVAVSVPGIAAPFNTAIQLTGSILHYQIDVPGDVAGTVEKEGGADGDILTFSINDRVVATGVWHSGSNTELDFHSTSVTLQPGWNLVSLNLLPVRTNIADVLVGLAGNYDLVYAWDGAGQHWLKYDANGPVYGNTLNTLDHSLGFWIHLTGTQAMSLAVCGSAPTSTNINLVTGWNLVGYPSSVTRALPGALSDHGVGTDFSLVYAYHASDSGDPWKLFDRTGAPFANDLNQMFPGWGYWINVNASSTWSVAYPADSAYTTDQVRERPWGIPDLARNKGQRLNYRSN